MKKFVYILSCLFLLSAGFAACSSDTDDPPEQPSSHQNEMPADSIDIDSLANHSSDSPIDSIHFSQIGLVGQWLMVKDGIGDAIQRGHKEILTFTDSMTFIESINYKRYCYGTIAQADDEWFHYDSTYHFYKGDFMLSAHYQEGDYSTTYHCSVFTKDSIMLKDAIFDGVLPIIAPEKYYIRIKNE